MESGDAIILRGGVYRTGSLLLNQGVTIQPYESERPVLKGTRLATEWEAAISTMHLELDRRLARA